MIEATSTGNVVNINLGADLLEVLQGHQDDLVNVQISVDEFRQLVHDAECYRNYGRELINKAKKWDSQHPAVRQALEEYQGCPLQIIPQ